MARMTSPDAVKATTGTAAPAQGWSIRYLVLMLLAVATRPAWVWVVPCCRGLSAAAARIFPPGSRPLKNVGEAGKTRQKRPRKRSLRVVNEHFEAVFNAVLPT